MDTDFLSQLPTLNGVGEGREFVQHVVPGRFDQDCSFGTHLFYPSSYCLDPHPSGLPDIFGTRSPTTSTPLPTILRRTCSSLGCSQSCIILSGVPACVCRSGFEINRNGRTCNGKHFLINPLVPFYTNHFNEFSNKTYLYLVGTNSHFMIGINITLYKH